MKKFEKIPLIQNKVENKISERSNEINNLLLDNYNFKQFKIIKETDWLSGSLSTYGRFTTPNNYASANFDIDQILDFKINPKFLPFLNIDVLTKTPDGIEAVAFFNYNREILEGDYVEVYGNGSDLIYKGTAAFTNGALTQARLDLGDFQESFTKKHYYTSIQYTAGGFDWKFQGSTTSDIQNIELVYNKVAVGSQFNRDILTSTRYFSGTYRISSDWGLGSPDIYIAADYAQHLRNHDRILSMSATSVQVVGTLTQERWEDTNDTKTVNPAGEGQNFIVLNYTPELINSITVNGNPVTVTSIVGQTVYFTPSAHSGNIIICDYQWLKPTYTVVDNQEVTKNWDDLDSFSLYQTNTNLYKKIGGYWVLQSTGNKIFDSSLITSVTSQLFYFRGYWLYWDDETRYQFGIQNYIPLTYEGDFRRKELYNFPTIVNIFEGDIVHGGSYVDEDYRTWSTISFARNPDGHPSGLTEFAVDDLGNIEKIILRNFKSTDANKDNFLLPIKGQLVFKVLADNEGSSLEYPVYNITYIKNTNSYEESSHTFTLKEAKYYTPTLPVVEYKIRVSLINPWLFSARDNYAI